MRMLTAALAALLMSATLGACASSAGRGNAAPAPLQQLPQDTAWRLQGSSYAGLEAGAGTGIRIVFGENRLSGDSGCNRFFAAATISEGRLQLGPVAASKRACIGPRMDVERALFEALRQLDQAFIIDGRLRLTTAGGAELVFVDDPAVAE